MTSTPTPTPHIRPATAGDAAALAAIYNHYVVHTLITFEETAVTPDEMARRHAATTSLGLPWLVAEVDGAVQGYAYASKWKERSGYRFSLEVTVYCAPDATARGLGTQLYTTLWPLLQAYGAHAVIGGIALPNDASIALHEKMGMHQVAHFEQTGFKFDRWVDVGYWQCTLPAPAA